MEYPNELVEAVKAVADAINGGGGSENYIEEYTGTLADLMGWHKTPFFHDLIVDLGEGNVDIIVEMDMSNFSSPNITVPLTRAKVGEGSTAITMAAMGYTTGLNGMYGEVKTSTDIIQDGVYGNIFSANKLIQFADGVATDMSDYAALVPTVTTIFYHPMPEE